jgi:hypothetical protein
MSDNFNPKNLGTVPTFGEFNTLDTNNTEDTIQFTLQSTNDTLSNAGRVLDKVDIVGYDFREIYFK